MIRTLSSPKAQGSGSPDCLPNALFDLGFMALLRQDTLDPSVAGSRHLLWSLHQQIEDSRRCSWMMQSLISDLDAVLTRDCVWSTLGGCELPECVLEKVLVFVYRA